MLLIGLTGSIATGKSFIANIFKSKNIPCFSSDEQVAYLLQNQEVIKQISNLNFFHNAIEDSCINKKKLSDIVFNNKELLLILERVLYPFIKEKRENFIELNKKEKIILLEIPLLYEKKLEHICHQVIVTYCDKQNQLKRALSRENLDMKKLDFILKNQLPCEEKIAKANFVINTSISKVFSSKIAEQIISKILVN